MEMDPESINRLPTDLATEARNLQQRSRTALEERQRHFLQNRTRISRRPNFTSGRPNMMRPSHNRLIRDMQNKMSNKECITNILKGRVLSSKNLCNYKIL